MKKYLYVVFLIFLLPDCNSELTSDFSDELEVPVVIENLIGKWNWIQSVDSTEQIVEEPTIINTMSILITQDYTFKQYNNDTLFFNDKFNLSKTVLPNTNDTLTFLDWRTSKRFNYIVFSLKSKTLIIGYSWGNKSIYIRIN
jgi:hypothetical protein